MILAGLACVGLFMIMISLFIDWYRVKKFWFRFFGSIIIGCLWVLFVLSFLKMQAYGWWGVIFIILLHGIAGLLKYKDFRTSTKFCEDPAINNFYNLADHYTGHKSIYHDKSMYYAGKTIDKQVLAIPKECNVKRWKE